MIGVVSSIRHAALDQAPGLKSISPEARSRPPISWSFAATGLSLGLDRRFGARSLPLIPTNRSS